MKEHRTTFRRVTWRAPEFIYRDKTFLWYTHAVVILFIVLFIFFLVRNYVAIAIISLLFWYFLSQANEKPKTVDYSVNNTGIDVGDRKLTYAEIHSFTVDMVQHTPVIICDLNYPFALPVTLIAHNNNMEEIVTLLKQFIPMRDQFSLMRWITLRIHY